jgi:uncharacterized membrane protein
LTAIAGAVMGGLAMKWFDSGVKNDAIRAAGEGLKSGMAALVVLPEEGSEVIVADKLRLNGGTVTGAALKEAAAELPEEPATGATTSSIDDAVA